MSLVISVQIMDPSMIHMYVGIVAFNKLWRIIVSKLISLTIPVIFIPNTVCLSLYGTYVRIFSIVYTVYVSIVYMCSIVCVVCMYVCMYALEALFM